MFQTIKKALSITQVLEDTVYGATFKQQGENTWVPEPDTCMFCSHNNCARIKQDENDLENAIYKCFSCDLALDVIGVYAKLENKTMGEAAKDLAAKYSIELPRDYSPVQAAMDMAAGYLHESFVSAKAVDILGGLSPLEYQTQKRGHTRETLKKFQVGWSNGDVVQYLGSVGVDPDIILETGLTNRRGNDFLPRKCFIYPHLINGRVSHFTFKDPLKKVEYQLKNKYKLNGHMFYNQDSIKLDGPVIVVEGENDLLSVLEAGWKSGVLATIGQISQAQIQWLEAKLSGRDLITIFDMDDGGNKYREKVARSRKHFRSLIQAELSNHKDIDEALKRGGDLGVILTAAVSKAKESAGVVDSDGSNYTETVNEGQDDDELAGLATGAVEDLPIVIKKGAYYRVKLDKEGNEFHVKLSNFTIRLRNIFIRGMEREREIVVRREDGKESEPFMIMSEAKVSLRPFRTLMANAVDASFYGKEEDLTAIWEHVYKTSAEVVVHLPECVGRIKAFKGWLFADCFIAETGGISYPDKEGVIWIQNNAIGLRPLSLEAQSINSADLTGVPKLKTDLTLQQREELIGVLLNNLSANLGDRGAAVNLIAWAWASVHSDQIFDAVGHFPFLFMWGKHGRGKTTILKWILALFDLETYGWTLAAQLNSGVSFSRKLSYYSSLPMGVDEIRVERNIVDMYGVFRSWYNRGGRVVSNRDGFGVRSQDVRSTIAFSGEDQFADPATRQRCIHVRIPQSGREELVSYRAIDSHSRDLPAIGYHWITNAHTIVEADMVRDIKSIDMQLRNQGLSSRTSLNWAIVSYFGQKLCATYMPEFDYMAYVIQSAQEDAVKQVEDDTLSEFWGLIEGLQVGERPRVTYDHIRTEDGKLHLWFTEIFRVAERENGVRKDSFSKRAILEALKEEDYFLSDMERVNLGVPPVQRRVITLDLAKVPEVLTRIAAFTQTT